VRVGEGVVVVRIIVENRCGASPVERDKSGKYFCPGGRVGSFVRRADAGRVAGSEYGRPDDDDDDDRLYQHVVAICRPNVYRERGTHVGYVIRPRAIEMLG